MIRIVLDGVDEAVKSLKAMAERLKNLRPAWQTVLAYLRRASEAQFATEGARSGSRWQPLSLAYAARKARRYPGQPILRASDAVFRSLVDRTADSIIEIEPQSLTYGTSRFYARFHQRGMGRNPRRQILAVTEQDRREIQKLVRLHLDNQSTLSGFERT